MAPAKNRRRGRLLSKSTSKQVSDEKPQKKQKETANNAKSTSQEVVNDKEIIEDEKGAVVTESVPTPTVKKPCSWLKLDRLDPQVGSKSSVQSSKHGDEANVTSKIETAKDNKRKRMEKNEEKGNSDLNSLEKHRDSRREKKEKEIHNDRHEDRDKRDDESGKKLGGLIFMCNAKTKADCFNYQLMGIPANKKEVVMNIKPGLTLFLYDYDLKLLYGIFEASSAGGMKLEPMAFGGAFPAQVRFAVITECIPLPESMFKKALKDSYSEKTRKFKTELTVKQVRNLTDMFRPTPRLHPHGPAQVSPTLLKEGYPNNYVPIPLHLGNELVDLHGCSNTARPRDPLFLTEQEYRNSGLQQGIPVLPATTGGDAGHPLEPNVLDQELKQLLRNPASNGTDSGTQQWETHTPNPNYPSEREYRTYGLRGPQQVPNAGPSRMTSNGTVQDSVEVCDPYDERTTMLVNRYLSMPMPKTVPADPYPLPGREPCPNKRNQLHDHRIHPAKPIPDGERTLASYGVGEQSDLNQRPFLLNSREPSCPPGEMSAPVSHRYSFSGPSL